MNLIVYNILNGRRERYHRGLALPEGVEQDSVEQDSAKATAALKLFSQKVDNCNYPNLAGWKTSSALAGGGARETSQRYLGI